MPEGDGTAAKAATGGATQEPSQAVSDRFPALKQLEEDAERAKLVQALAEARAATAKAQLPSLDVDVTPDSVTTTDKTTGLGRVLVQIDSIALADDIADIVLDAARDASPPIGESLAYTFRVASNPAVFNAVDTYRLLEGGLLQLRQRLDVEAPPGKKKKKDEPQRRDIAVETAAALATLAVQGIGLVTKLFARSYQVAGREVTPDDIGFDLLVADYLTAKKHGDEIVTVEADRILPTTGSSKIVSQIWQLARDVDKRLVPVLASEASELAEAKARVETSEKSLTALDAEILELTKLISEPEPRGKTGDSGSGEGADAASASAAHVASDASALLDKRKTDRRQLEESIPGFKAKLATAQAIYDRAADLVGDVQEFVSAALAPPASGGRAPALDAARIEPFVKSWDEAETESPRHFFLYARLLASGLDDTISARVGDADWRTLVGASAEFALIGTGGTLLASGVRSVFQSSKMDLDSADKLEQNRVAYVSIERKSRDES